MMLKHIAITCVLLAVAGSFGAVLADDAIELPTRKAGYWQITMVDDSDGKIEPLPTTHLCIDPATDKLTMQAGLSMTEGLCEKVEMKRDGAAYVMDTVCTIGEMKSVSHIVIDGDFQSAYSMKLTGTIDGLPAAAGGGKDPQITSLLQNAKWLGEKCPNGVKPGEMVIPGGEKINVVDMMKSMDSADKERQEPGKSEAAPLPKK